MIYQDRCCDVLKTWCFDNSSDGFMPGDLELIIGTAIPTLGHIWIILGYTHLPGKPSPEEKRDSISAYG